MPIFLYLNRVVVWALRIKTVDEKLRLSGTGTGTGTGNNRRSVRKSMMLPRSVFSWGALETRTGVQFLSSRV